MKSQEYFDGGRNLESTRVKEAENLMQGQKMKGRGLIKMYSNSFEDEKGL